MQTTHYRRATCRKPTWLALLAVVCLSGLTACASKPAKPRAETAMQPGSGMSNASLTQDPINPALSPAQKKEQEKLLHQKLIGQMMEQGSYYAALAHADAYDKQWGSDAASRLLRADARRATGQLDGAEKLYTPLLSSTLRPQALHGLSKLAAQRGQWEISRKLLDDAISAAPLNANLYNDQGLVLTLLNKRNEALIALRKSQELEPDRNLARANIALFAAVYDDTALFDAVSRQLEWQASDVQAVKAQALRIKLAHHKKQMPDPDIFSARSD
jgi:Flp pilus assembly protein TadD